MFLEHRPQGGAVRKGSYVSRVLWNIGRRRCRLSCAAIANKFSLQNPSLIGVRTMKPMDRLVTETSLGSNVAPFYICKMNRAGPIKASSQSRKARWVDTILPRHYVCRPGCRPTDTRSCQKPTVASVRPARSALPRGTDSRRLFRPTERIGVQYGVVCTLPLNRGNESPA